MLGLTLASTPSASEAQAWVRDVGNVYAKLYAGTFQSNGVYDLDGEFSRPDFVYENVAVGFYGEVGIFRDLGLTVATAFYRATNTVLERTQFRRHGMGDLALGLSYQVARTNGCAFAVGLRTIIPLYAEGIQEGANVGTTGATGEARFFPALGDGSVDVHPTFSAGCGLSPIRGWASMTVGHAIRTGGFGDGIVYAADVGSFVWRERLALTARVDGIQTLTRGDRMPTKSYVSVGGGTIVRLGGPVSLELNFSYIPTGVFVARGWSLVGGISLSGDLLRRREEP